ncbi:glycosyltransferase [Halolamina salifodinae]|uniref:Glycosyltransferase involved in cell wall biosynthesis n=1 Tax=Halolamina salifodinae TaxID=1202767 RepID=A0A8T4GTT7_9EURY|nr:glycosyltransferase [Halolamina salifodinae]MBP1985562.1 glycosyltransferase involved in cell wall biosynthesis [Halolamina salifodinae]
MPRSVGLVVPAYQPNVDRLSRYVCDLDDRLNPAELRIELDDPSPGDEAALADLPATVHVADRRRGKGAAITEGFDALSTDVLAFADADGSTPADSVADVIEPVASGEFDLAAGSRRHPDATVQSHQKTLRRLLGDGFAWLARQLLVPNLYDYQCGAKAVSANFWARLRRHLTEPGFAWDIELLAIAGALGGKIAEVPVVWEDKPESTVDPVRDTLSMFTGLLAARHRAKAVKGGRLHELLADRRDQRLLIERGER